ncbi:DUF4232 domain-containing protein [Kutzneria sp. CA-103260]|uniref:DUF4232 domain-containing protein n=1 Tax=Kutzneria sp. CA-103260 TaxID=2802641 RepID=UPI001BA7E3E5|nr:DUF4232 domain-containing protein [Kutzneria sp. CA-103260]QUQ62904.1 hypothetical protein JJ691_06160 [Kutzneria sp. CA-103260]
MTAPESDFAAVVVAPGDTATTSLTIRNDSEIVEAYTFEVIGPCAPWTTVEPERLPLYPGTSGVVTLRLAPPRSPEVRAGDVPLAVRVRPTQRPELATVPETTVTIEPFAQLTAALTPRRRRAAWRAGFHVRLANNGNTPIDVGLDAADAGEELRYNGVPSSTALHPGEDAEVRLRVRGSRLIWFGSPVTSSFQVTATPTSQDPTELDGELVQTALLPRWPLALLPLALALLVAWFALARPAVTSDARPVADAPAPTTQSQSSTAAAPSSQPPAAPQPAGPCHTADLSATLGPRTEVPADMQSRLGDAGKHYSTDVVLTNISDHTCTMRGFPGVDIASPNEDQPGGVIYSLPRTADTPVMVTLSSGGAAHTTIHYIDPTGYTTMPLWTPTHLDVTPPNESTHLSVPLPDGTAVYQGWQDGLAAGSVSPVIAGPGVVR